jgi:hypothetical protein
VSHGLEVWDAHGQKMVSIDARFKVLHSIWNFNATAYMHGGSSGLQTVSIPAIRNDGRWHVQIFSEVQNVSPAIEEVQLYSINNGSITIRHMWWWDPNEWPPNEPFTVFVFRG